MPKSKRAKALGVSKKVRSAVYERDGGWCVLCGRPGFPSAHYIARSQGGLGIEENIVTLCFICHRNYDQSTARVAIRDVLRDYLKGKYFDWDEEKLIYDKFSYLKGGV